MRAKLVESTNVEKLGNDELKELHEKDPESKVGIIAKTELERRKTVNGNLEESFGFKRGRSPHDALKIGHKEPLFFDASDGQECIIQNKRETLVFGLVGYEMILSRDQVLNFYNRLLNLSVGIESNTRVNFGDSKGSQCSISPDFEDADGNIYCWLGPTNTQMRLTQENVINIIYELKDFMNDY